MYVTKLGRGHDLDLVSITDHLFTRTFNRQIQSYIYNTQLNYPRQEIKYRCDPYVSIHRKYQIYTLYQVILDTGDLGYHRVLSGFHVYFPMQSSFHEYFSTIVKVLMNHLNTLASGSCILQRPKPWVNSCGYNNQASCNLFF